MLLHNFESCIVSNGHVSEHFPITRSIQQGSPISSLLFLVTGQLLNSMLKSNDKIQGVKIDDQEYLISQFADDTDLYLMFDQETFNQVVEVFNKLENNIGLKVNYDKTSIYRMGSLENTNAQLYTMRVFQWVNNPPNILGVNLVEYTDTKAILSNFQGIMDKVEAVINNWQNRNLTLSGKIVLINSLIASLFVYKMSVLPNVPYSTQ